MRQRGCRHHFAGRVLAISKGSGSISPVSVDIVIPVFNEERALPGCVAILHAYLDERFPFDWTITVVDNASTDGTRAIAGDLALRCPRIRVLCLDRKGKGHAVRSAWSTSRADVVAYMDVDLSTGLDALLPLVAALANGHSDIAIGSRLAPGARTVRGVRREVISRGYNAVLRMTHRVRFSDAQCGFKAARADVIRPLLRHVEDDSWFFDTELLLLAEHNGLRVHEVAVDWVEDVDSRVGVVGTAAVNLRGTARLAVARASGAADVAGLPTRPPPRPTHPDAVLAGRRPAKDRRVPLLGVATAATLGLYTVLRLWWPQLIADVVAISLIAWLGARAARLSALALGLSYLLTCGALAVLDAMVHRPGRLLELAALLGAAVIGTAGYLAMTRAPAPRRQPAGQRDGVIVRMPATGPGDRPRASAAPQSPHLPEELSA